MSIYKTNLCILANISHGHSHFGAGSKGICSTDVLFFQYISPPTTKLSRFFYYYLYVLLVQRLLIDMVVLVSECGKQHFCFFL